MIPSVHRTLSRRRKNAFEAPTRRSDVMRERRISKSISVLAVHFQTRIRLLPASCAHNTFIQQSTTEKNKVEPLEAPEKVQFDLTHGLVVSARDRLSSRDWHQ